MEKIIISNGPSQKFGSDKPSSENSNASRSIQPPRRTAATVARGNEIKTAAILAHTARSKVAGKRADDRSYGRSFIKPTTEIARCEIK
jgi:hypothetical protein